MRINGLIKSLETTQRDLFSLVKHMRNDHDLSIENPEINLAHQNIIKTSAEVERLCRKHKATPADLPNPSYRAYQWFRFLSHKKHLLTHLHALNEFHNQANQIISAKSRRSPRLEIKIAHSGYLFRVNQNNSLINLELNEGFITAPIEIKKKLLESALNKKNRQHAKAIRSYTRSDGYKQISDELNSDSEVNQRSYIGKHFNLKDLFTEINQEYFRGKLEQPRLMWSARRSKRRLGYYDPQSNTITINRRFDTADTPRLLVKYILYHEMLHQHLGTREVNGRRYAHTSAFRKAEKRFRGYEEAESLIQTVNR